MEKVLVPKKKNQNFFRFRNKMEKGFSSKKKEPKLFQVSKQDGKNSSKKKNLNFFSFLNKMKKVLVPKKNLSSYHLKKYFRYIWFAFFLIFLFLSAIYFLLFYFFVFFFFIFFLKFQKKSFSSFFLELKLFSSFFQDFYVENLHEILGKRCFRDQIST